MKEKHKLVAIILIVCAVLLAGALFVWASPCSGLLELTTGKTVPMRCHWLQPVGACIAVLWIGMAIDILRTKHIPVLAIILTGAMIFSMTINSTFGIGVCANKTMVCQSSALWLKIIGVIAALTGVYGFIDSSKQL